MEAKWTETADVEEIFNAAAAGHHEVCVRSALRFCGAQDE